MKQRNFFTTACAGFLAVATAALWNCSSLRAQATRPQPEPAQRADDFVDRIGVATHWGYTDTPYGFAYDQAKKLLGDSGIRHVRDGYHAREADLFQAYGIKSTLIFGPGDKAPGEQIKVLEPNAAMVAMIEGPNEVDIFPQNARYNGKTFPQGAVDYQNDLYAAVKANPLLRHIPVIAPSTARADSNLRLAPLRSFDYLVMHPYAGGQLPVSSLESDVNNNLRNAARILGNGAVLKPIVVTESGYHTALGADLTLGGVQPGVSETAHAKYIPRHYAEYFNAGIVRAFVYEFLNEFPDEATNAEASFGLVRRDLSPKPAYGALKNLIALLSEAKWNPQTLRWEKPKPAFAPRALSFSLSGDARNVHHTLLQKADGDFYLLLWQEVSSFDTRAKKDIANPPVSVTLTLQTPVASASTHRIAQGTQPLQIFQNPQQIRLEVPDQILVVRLRPRPARDVQAPPAPIGLRATTTADAITLSWPQAPAGAGVRGYFVSRLGRYLGRAAGTRFTDTKLSPGTGYTYEVRAYDAAGNVSPPAAIVASTPALFPDLVITDISWTPDKLQAGGVVVFQATIKNVGTAATPGGVTHGVAFFVDGAFVSWSDSLRGPLAPGETRTVTANNGPQGKALWTVAPGAHTIAAQVDDVNRINESNEENNRLEKQVAAAP